MLASASPQGVKYNIPVCFWLPEGYPRQGPLCFVTPTPDMVVKPGHPCVDANGAVAAPYLQRWTFPSHTLCGCAAQLAELFSRDPPLYSKPPAGAPAAAAAAGQHHHVHAGSPPAQQQYAQQHSAAQAAAAAVAAASAEAARWQQQQQQQQPPSQQQRSVLNQAVHYMHSGVAQPPAASGSSSIDSQARHAPPPRPAVEPPPPPPPPRPPAPSGPPPEETFSEAALSVLTRRARECLVAAAAAESDDVAALLDEQRCLEDRRAALAAALPPLRAEREGLEHHITALRAATVALDAWLGENAVRVPEGLSADDALQGEDAWARQALSAAAEDAGVEDTLYVLAQGLEAGVVPLDQYLKLVRGLCREQFFARATVLVVQAARRERRGS